MSASIPTPSTTDVTMKSSEKIINQHVENDYILTITYRQYNHLYTNHRIIDRSHTSDQAYEPTLLEWILAFIIVHYFLWMIAMIGGVALIWYSGYKYIAIALVLIYLPSYFNKDEWKIGRPWHSMRLSSTIWHPMQRYLQVEAVREAKLDPHKQYIFAAHPHGILILSRPAVYAGVFECLFPVCWLLFVPIVITRCCTLRCIVKYADITDTNVNLCVLFSSLQ
jgi:hypothetical protein